MQFVEVQKFDLRQNKYRFKLLIKLIYEKSSTILKLQKQTGKENGQCEYNYQYLM